ncbi:MAG TPA: VanZ family protein [Candidatus Hypogeohydataceae bacterium YC40]
MHIKNKVQMESQNMNEKKPSGIPSWLRWLPAISYAGLIFVASSIPQPIPEIPIPYIDKPIHFIEYAILCLLLCWPHSANTPGPPEADTAQGESTWPIKKVVLFSIVAASLYGASDEIHQYFVPGRCCEFSDWVSDTLGASFAGFLWYRRKVSP